MKQLNARQRKFCELVASGRPAGRAYEEAGYTARGASADTEAYKLGQREEIKACIAELQQGTAKEFALTRDQMLVDLLTIWQSPPSAASMDNPLCELVVTKMGPVAVFPDKGRIAERLVRMLGWEAPKKHEHAGDPKLLEILAGVRGGK